MAEAVSTFISYFHEDMEFVDRLDADLQARGFVTWVDRRRLEGTTEWPPQIDSAIDSLPMMIVVLSQGALDSEYVRYEYERGHKLDKRIVTVRYREFYIQLPPELSDIQYVDFMDKSGESYNNALRVLIVGCQNPHPHQPANPRLLYEQAHDLERIDAERERAASLYQRLLINNPQYAGGEAQRDLERLNQKLYPQRAQILREKAEMAHKAGQYSEEVGALRALIDLGDQDLTMLERAQEYLRVAEENSQQMDLYDFIQKRAKRGEAGDLADARSKLEILWAKARFFRDPAGVAPILGLADKVPMTFEQWKELHGADMLKHRREQDAAAGRDSLIAQAQSTAKAAADEENTRWQTAKEDDHDLTNMFIITLTIAVVIFEGVIALKLFPAGDCVTFAFLLILIVVTVSVATAIAKTPGGRAWHVHRLSNIESELQMFTSEAQAQYQRRMDEIAAEHTRTLAEIEARYADG